MDRIISIGRWQWRAWWRRLSRTGHLNAGNQGIILIFSILILARYLRSLHTAAMELPQGRTRVFESLLLGIFLAWMFPLVSNARSSTSIRKLRHLPLTHNELFGISMLTLLFPPYAWIILGGSFAICYPILAATNRTTGVVAAGLFIAFSALTGVTVAQLLSRSIFRKLLFVVLLLSGLGIFYLAQIHGAARLAWLSSFFPSALVTRAALATNPWVAVFALAVLATLAFFAALGSFKLNLDTPQQRQAQKIAFWGRLRIPGAVGNLAAKDFRYFRRLLDPYLGVLVAALACLYLLTAPVASVGWFQVFLLGVFVPNASVAFNLFGLDKRAGLDRLKLMPVTGRTILLGKNLAFVGVVGVQVLPLILLACWRLGLLIGAIGIVETVSLAAMYLAWGNWMSVNHPCKMQFFQFSSSSAVVMEVMAGIMFGSLPGIMAIYSLHTGGLEDTWKVALVMLLSCLIYFISVWRMSTRFEQKQDKIAAALS